MRLEPRDRVIVALDTAALDDAIRLVERLAGVVSTFKIGSELFTAAGPEAVARVRATGGRVFLDLKLHDIPATVAGAVRAAASLGVAFITIHAAGGAAMVRAASDAAASAGPDRPRILAVTLLTSLDRAALQRDLLTPVAVEGQVVHLAVLARSAGVDGIVASPREAGRLRAVLGRSVLVVTPGIRPAGAAADDQARIATPAAAIRAGADCLVVGRPITGAPDPVRAAADIVEAVSR